MKYLLVLYSLILLQSCDERSQDGQWMEIIGQSSEAFASVMVEIGQEKHNYGLSPENPDGIYKGFSIYQNFSRPKRATVSFFTVSRDGSRSKERKIFLVDLDKDLGDDFKGNYYLIIRGTQSTGYKVIAEKAP